ncbi:hypothetical protein QVD17_21809 [Tagetes erecta]|uniref:F-box domain-containing protein n=1 Tax=Tagetes erecta TaxID=13708 RepID=A0AAD8KFW9_TARER|nr:hypothetical protein QVD17_21809 [Tagetes erecta]
MSDNLPFEIQLEIMKKLPVKSLIQFRSVSKTWKYTIDSTHFISTYSSQAPHLLVSHEHDSIYISIADDHNFPQHQLSLTTPQLIHHCDTIDSSHGLLCLYIDYLSFHPTHFKMNMVVLWNVSIRKLVGVVVPNVGNGMFKTEVGFGVCRETVDPKIVKITYIDNEKDVETVTSIPWQVEVFSLSDGVWRLPYNNLPRKSIRLTHVQVALDGFIYWLAENRIRMDNENKTCSLIVSFDMTSEEFREVRLPDCLAQTARCNLYMSKLRESLVVVEQSVEANNLDFVVWIMEDGVSKSFTKLFGGNVYTPEYAWVLGFRNNGEVIIEIIDDGAGKLVVYEPSSEHINDLGIINMKWSLSVCSYKETLLLLDHPYLTVYNGNNTLKFEDDLSHEQIKSLLKM